MISDFFFINKLFVENLDKKFDFEEIEKTGISQLEVRYNSREFEEKVSSGNFETEFRISTKKLKYLGSEYKLYTYIILRLLSIRNDNQGYYGIIFEDYCNYLNKKTFSNNERYFYLSSLEDNMFCYEIDTVLFHQKSRRNFYRILYTRIPQRNNIRLVELIVEIINSGTLLILPKKRPKRLQRHKGYRDHGSLGSEFSKTLKDQSSDWRIREEEEKEKKKQQDFIQFLLGLNGFI